MQVNTYITVDECLLLSCWAWIYLLFSKHCRSRSASFLANQDPHCFHLCLWIHAVCLGEIYYISLFRRLFPKRCIFPKKCITHLCMHAPQPTIYGYGRNVHLLHFTWQECPWPKCRGPNPLGWNVCGLNVLHLAQWVPGQIYNKHKLFYSLPASGFL